MRRESSIGKRVSQLRDRYRQAGLKRVEVLVPIEQADAVKAYAAQLREGSESERMGKVRKLLAKAYQKHHATCLDNIGVKPAVADFADAAIVATALMHRGNTEAFKLGRQIRSLAK